MRFGFFPDMIKNAIGKKSNIWIHAVSLGEVIVVSGLIQSLKKKFPNDQVVLTTVTQGGYTVARSKLQDADVVIYAPLDFSWVVRKYIHLIRPRIYIVAETEIWPNLLTALHRKRIPIVLINGRISDRAFRGYSKIKFFIKRILDYVSVFCMQSPIDAKRIEALGVNSQKITVVGNIKFDDLPASTEFGLHDFGFQANESLWIAGSTHPGEEEIVLKIFKSLSSEFSDLRLVIAPRHIERADEVARLVTEVGFSFIRLSQLHSIKLDHRSVVIVDTIGHLRSLYSLSKIVFVGKSLAVGGGHNIIEPAFFGNPIFIGPRMQNFKDIVQVFLEDQAVVQVQNAKELEQKMRELLHNPKEMKRIGQAARLVVQKYRGATKKTMEIIGAQLI